MAKTNKPYNDLHFILASSLLAEKVFFDSISNEMYRIKIFPCIEHKQWPGWHGIFSSLLSFYFLWSFNVGVIVQGSLSDITVELGIKFYPKTEYFVTKRDGFGVSSLKFMFLTWWYHLLWVSMILQSGGSQISLGMELIETG